MTGVNIDLAGTPAGAGDGQPDRVVVKGTNGDDTVDVSGDANVVKVSGLTATTKILHPEAANDRLEVTTLAGRDTVAFWALAPNTIQLLVNGVIAPWSRPVGNAEARGAGHFSVCSGGGAQTTRPPPAGSRPETAPARA